jgi:hypothetical protein
MSRIGGSARVVLGLGLVALLMLPRWGDGGGAAISVGAETSVTELAQALDGNASTVSYESAWPPTREITALMVGAAERGIGVTLAVPGSLPALEVRAPADPVAMRRAALEITVRGDPTEVVPIVIGDPTGAADTISVELDASGVGTVTAAVQPTRAGAAEWTVRALGESRTVHAWTRPEQSVRVLLITGPPSWESRYLARALDASGTTVAVHQALGREMTVATSDVALPTTTAELDAYDVVAVVGPLDDDILPGDVEAAIGRWITERGGGLLLAGPGAIGGTTLGQWSVSGSVTPINAQSLEWSGPAEIVPLPAADLDVRLASLPTGGVPVARSATGDLVHAAAVWIGRGRVFTSGLETWPYAMDAGLVQEHVDWWESVVEWLAGGLRLDTRLVGPTGAPGVMWSGDLRSTGGDASTRLRFVADVPGGRPLTPGGAHGAVVASRGDRHSWIEAALEVGGAGAAVSRASGASAQRGREPSGSPAPPWLAFLSIALLALTAWTTRRLAGEP